MKSETGPYTQGKERQRKEADHYRLVGGSVNKQGNLHMRIVLGGLKTRSLHLTSRILKVYTEGLPGFIHIFSPDGLNNTFLSQVHILQRPSLWQQWAEYTFQGQGMGCGGFDCPGQVLRLTGGHIFLITSSNTNLPQW